MLRILRKDFYLTSTKWSRLFKLDRNSGLEKLKCIIDIWSPCHNDYSSSSSYKTKRTIIADTEALLVLLPSTIQKKNLTKNYFDFKYETFKGYSKTEPLYFSNHLECKLDFYERNVFSCLKKIGTKTWQPSWQKYSFDNISRNGDQHIFRSSRSQRHHVGSI